MKPQIFMLVLLLALAACSGTAAEPGDVIATAVQQTIAASQPTAPPPTATIARITATPSVTPVVVTATPDATPTIDPADDITASCAQRYPAYITDVDRLLLQWDEADELASNTPRLDMSDRILELQNLFHAVETLDVPECGSKTHRWIVRYMDLRLDTLLNFMSNGQPLSRDTATRLDNIQDRIAENYTAMFQAPD